MPTLPVPVQVKGASFEQQRRLDRLKGLCRMLAPQQKPANTLAALGVFDFYPYLAAHMCGHQWGPGVQQAGAAYMAYVSVVNQVVMMGTQLYNDAAVQQHHKYTAHQIALLYVSPQHRGVGRVWVGGQGLGAGANRVGRGARRPTGLSPILPHALARCPSAAIPEHAAGGDEAYSAAGRGEV